jgi:hypothetical protein
LRRKANRIIMFRFIELGIQRTFAGFARASAARPLLISLSTLFVLLALGFGVFNIEVETDLVKLWVDDSTALINVRAPTIHKPHNIFFAAGARRTCAE